jgi:hypothetical protein
VLGVSEASVVNVRIEPRTTSAMELYVGSIVAFLSVTSFWNLTIAAFTSSIEKSKMIA